MDVKDKIKNDLNVSDVISSLTGQRKGTKYVCPFHPDNEPSLGVYANDKKWKCLSAGCGVGGDVIRFVELYNNVDFRTALEYLADTYGYELENRKSPEEKLNVPLDIKINNYSWELFNYTIKNTDCAESKLCSERKLSLDYLGACTMTAKQLATVLARNINRDHEQRVTMKDIVNSSDLFTIDKSINKIVLTYKDRLLIPLFDSNGTNVLGFAGRTMVDDDRKYINPRNNVNHYGYQKSSYLYNYHNAKGNLEVIVTEGYFDCLSFLSLGVNNVVAIGGTNLTEEQFNMLIKRSSSIVLALDNDLPGMNAMFKIQLQHPTYLFKFGLYPPEHKDANDALLSGELDKFVITDLQDFLIRMISFYDISDRKVRIDLYDKIAGLIDKIRVNNRGFIIALEIKKTILNKILKGGDAS